ncbi:MAG TPA: rRNA methyltransferase [Pasteurellaceae bacterium]|nr:rRNA methyltransferase [Pasteurellaceae bacterium]
MNNDKKPVFQPLKPQQNDEKHSKTRSFKEQQTGKQNKNRPHFEHKQESRSPKSGHLMQQITETIMDNASGTRKVKVVVKSSALTDKPKQKKTGPLSPRAPEKIKKNRSEEMKVYGEGACLALFAQRPESIIRLWATVETAHKIGNIFSYLAANKKVYHVVDNQELELVSGTEHHGGICMLVKKARPFTLAGYLDIPRKEDCLVLLDGVRNAHNIGGILRTCAFYGVKGVITETPELINSSAAMRVAEGGMEYIHTLQTDYADNALTQLRQAGYQIIHTTTDKQAKRFNKTQLKNKVVFVLSEGSSEALVQAEDELVSLSLINPLKNGLNIAVRAGILLSGWYLK